VNKRKLLEKAQRGRHNLHFDELVALAEAFGFRLHHIVGDHHIYIRESELGRLRLNLQPHRGKAKAYQVEQLLMIVKEYGLVLED
jgi:hypothetical protein